MSRAIYGKLFSFKQINNELKLLVDSLEKLAVQKRKKILKCGADTKKVARK